MKLKVITPVGITQQLLSIFSDCHLIVIYLCDYAATQKIPLERKIKWN